MRIAVNGTLMRGLELERNMIAADAEFVTEAKTAPVYRLFSVDDRYPAMLRVSQSEAGFQVSLELWEVSPSGLVSILVGEPAGLTLGKVELADGSQTLGILAESWLVLGKNDISSLGGWREYLHSKQKVTLSAT